MPQSYAEMMLSSRTILILLTIFSQVAVLAQSSIVIGRDQAGYECYQRAEIAVQFNVADADDVDFCTKALDAAPLAQSDKAAILVNRGVLLATMLKLDDAEASYREALDLADDIGETHINIANLLLNQKHYQKAVEHYTAGIPLMKRKVQVAYLNRGLAYEYMENFSAAAADYEQALTFNPEWFRAKKMLARAQAKSKP